MKTKIKSIISIFKDAIDGLSKHGLMTYAASTAFYTIFSLPGLLITIVMVAGIFLGQEAVKGQISTQIDGLMGKSAAETIEGILTNIELTGSGTIGTIIGVGTLLFSATTVFVSLQTSLNVIWEVKSKPKKGWLKFIINKALSLGMVVSLGFILLVSLMLDTLLDLFMGKIESYIGDTSALILDISGTAIAFLIVAILFGLIFKVLPDVSLKWNQVRMGALITAGLFILGKSLIGIYIGQSNFSATYETAGSTILILVWVYYSTVIILFGAELTRAIIRHNGHIILPSENAVKVVLEEMEKIDGKYIVKEDSKLNAENVVNEPKD